MKATTPIRKIGPLKVGALTVDLLVVARLSQRLHCGRDFAAGCRALICLQ
jgi:hypothetical protein